MMFNSPLSVKNSKVNLAARIVNIIFSVGLLTEFLFKIIVFGCIANGKYSYFRTGWNLFEFFIVVCSILSVYFENYAA